ncbi:MAG TPA: IclR family transcriptional regulator [Bacillus bacterium]|uniref:IclR family transcriptional regulator n=1 Tax=Siminovitchia fordii TaxID=254759 RepID=A0ABQ4K3S3_9BACI|nr:IclR family transcriptional regulator [Siminovitchia fordii]GIN19513.1 IclR family transcriptional regulator [Siminovitchia fordii]HBZ11617.1 IclR family transcriptional regulator [Bacillus sp. (in: firmicutes)]
MIASVKRACAIISCFTREEPVLGNAEIAEKLGLSRSTTHHLISTLCNEGVLIRDIDRKYRLGWKLLEWNNSVMFQQDFYNRAMPLVKELTDRFRGTAHIGMFDKGDVVFVLRISSEDADSVPTYLGARKPAYCTSAGKALLAYNNAYLQETIDKGLLQQGPNTITDIRILKKDLESVRKQGYSISNNENDTCTYAIAAPIMSYSGETIASVNLVGPTSYMKSLHRSHIIQSVVNTAKAISRELGYIEVNGSYSEYSKKFKYS